MSLFSGDVWQVLLLKIIVITEESSAYILEWLDYCSVDTGLNGLGVFKVVFSFTSCNFFIQLCLYITDFLYVYI